MATLCDDLYGSALDRDALFVSKVDWLDRIAKRSPPDPAELLIASGQIRLLITDRTRLLDQVNGSRNFDIRFRVLDNRNPIAVLSGATFWAVQDGLAPALDPNNKRNREILSLSCDAFLQERVMVYVGEDVTVKDLVRFCAHTAGGVHAGDPEGGNVGKEAKLADLGERILVGGMDPAVRSLRGIALVVVEALRPLRDSIVEAG